METLQKLDANIALKKKNNFAFLILKTIENKYHKKTNLNVKNVKKN